MLVALDSVFKFIVFAVLGWLFVPTYRLAGGKVCSCDRGSAAELSESTVSDQLSQLRRAAWSSPNGAE